MQPGRGEVDDDRDEDDEVARDGDASRPDRAWRSRRRRRGDRTRLMRIDAAVGGGAGRCARAVEAVPAPVPPAPRNRQRQAAEVDEHQPPGVVRRWRCPPRTAGSTRRSSHPHPRCRPTLACLAATPGRVSGDCERRAIATPITTPRSPVTVANDEKRSERDEQDRDDEPGVELRGLGDHHGEPCTSCTRRPPPPCRQYRRVGVGSLRVGESPASSVGTGVHRRLPYPRRYPAHVCGGHAALPPRAVGVDAALVEEVASELDCMVLHGSVSFVVVVVVRHDDRTKKRQSETWAWADEDVENQWKWCRGHARAVPGVTTRGAVAGSSPQGALRTDGHRRAISTALANGLTPDPERDGRECHTPSVRSSHFPQSMVLAWAREVRGWIVRVATASAPVDRRGRRVERLWPRSSGRCAITAGSWRCWTAKGARLGELLVSAHGAPREGVRRGGPQVAARGSQGSTARRNGEEARRSARHSRTAT